MKRAALIALALILMLGFGALGVWQVERRAWKLDLIARVEARIHAPPVPIADARGDEYRRVTATGTLLHDKTTRVQALTERGAGFWLLTPLRTAQGIVLVNRGFVPAGWRAPRERAHDVTVTGLLRISEPHGGFLRANAPVADRWYSRDVAAIAAARRLGPIAPVFVDADASPNSAAYPIGGLTVVRFNNNHLVYALTWFGLAGLSGFAAFLLAKARPR
ncbi:SURF1 family protein [Sphingomonas montanisoli]|uniref:SURF1-like protein n=1 Tax=Sphingomonas montanisoli TaxID=2606412 RepID=A0A5D9CE07_9SPHN|nr:SURF1 family protein [Sphingomonas montanisoli]TZG29443.1 SURF1 family protein [Sphingomonas montanisoli]